MIKKISFEFVQLTFIAKIFIDYNAMVFLADFGFARHLQTDGMAATLCGSPMYMVSVQFSILASSS